MKEPDWAHWDIKELIIKILFITSAPKQKEKISSLDEVDPNF